MRPLIYGNGTLLVCTDERGIVRDFYYPYAGMENHGGSIRLGLFDRDKKAFGWLDEWNISQRYENSSLIGETFYSNVDFDAAVTVKDMVHQELNFFLRSFEIKNVSTNPKHFRLFSSQNYHILENNYANTAVRDGHMMNHYKRDRFILQSSLPAFDQFTTGISEWRGMEGTWKDAEDGELAGNVVAHGTVDSTIGWTLPELEAGRSTAVYFWACIARSFPEAKRIDDWIRARDINTVYHAGRRFWNAFCAKAWSFGTLRSADRLPASIRDAFSPQPAHGRLPHGQGRLYHSILRFRDQAAGCGLLYVLLAAGRRMGGHRHGQGGLWPFEHEDAAVFSENHRPPGLLQA